MITGKKKEKKEDKESIIFGNILKAAAIGIVLALCIILVYYLVMVPAAGDVKKTLGDLANTIQTNPLWILGVVLFGLSLISALFLRDYPVIFIALIIGAGVVTALAWYYTSISTGGGVVTDTGSGRIIGGKVDGTDSESTIRTKVLEKFKEIYANENEVYIIGANTLKALIGEGKLIPDAPLWAGHSYSLIGFAKYSPTATIRDGIISYSLDEMIQLARSKLYPFYVTVDNKNYTILAPTDYYRLQVASGLGIVIAPLYPKTDLIVSESECGQYIDLSYDKPHVSRVLADCILRNTDYMKL